MLPTHFAQLDPADLNNVSQLLSHAAAQVPQHTAVAVALRRTGAHEFSWDTISYRELDHKATAIAKGLLESGIPPGTRLALMVRPGVNFIALVFGLMRAGMVQILIDPGMGRQHMLNCLQSTQPQGFVGIPLAQAMRVLFSHRFRSAVHNVTVGWKWGWGGHTLSEILRRGESSERSIPATSPQDLAAIIFTTGSTGPPKGVRYSHQMFIQQATQIRDYYQIQPGGVDLSGFPLFALFNIGMGVTTVIPEMDPTRPAEVKPQNIIDAVNHWKADQSFGSPALWNTVSLYCEKHHVQLPSLRRVFSAGAPVPPHVLQRVEKMLAAGGQIYTPYGATEALPVASHSAAEILRDTAQASRQGAGTCVGRPFAGIRWKVIRISDEAIPSIDDIQEMPCGEIGELMVSGPVVSPAYWANDAANALHKVFCSQDATVWHRMGDVGYLDPQHRFWFCGRKGHRVLAADRVLFTIPVESIVNNDPAIYRSALVGIGEITRQTPVMVLEPWPQHFPSSGAERQALIERIRSLCAAHELTRGIEHFLIRRKLPVDIRHNSKIFREQLRSWAMRQFAR